MREVVHSPGFDTPIIDAAFNDYWARGLVTNDWTPPKGEPDPMIRVTPYLRPPGYPYFLASAYRVFGLSYLTPRIVQMLLGLENCLLAFALARKWFGDGAGLVASALTAASWLLTYFEAQMQEVTLLTFLLLAFVYVASLWIDRRGLGLAFLAGLLLGLAGVTKPNPLLFAPVAVAWMWWVAGRRHERRATYLKAAAGLTAGVILAVAPTTIRNYAVSGEPILISANSGLNLYIGNNEQATGIQLGALPELGVSTTCFLYPELVRRLSVQQGRPMSYSDASSYFAGQAGHFIRTHPWAFLQLSLKRAALFWGPQEISLNEVMECEREYSATLSHLPGGFTLGAALGVFGLIGLAIDLRRERQTGGSPAAESEKRKEAAVLLLAFIVTFFASYWLFFNASSYRTPLLPFLFVLGGFGLVRLGRMVLAKDYRRAGAWLAIGVAIYAIASIDIVGYPTPGAAAWHCNRGRMYARKGRPDLAVEEGRAALRIEPQSADIRERLATWLRQAGRPQEAEELSRKPSQ
ncbi:MAG TPA: glycosyltransferase family 39 protein [Phycisphaerae bacterium]|nr:glycosyltransferase family 39 protein [Phycisphaerae bacterium]